MPDSTRTIHLWWFVHWAMVGSAPEPRIGDAPAEIMREDLPHPRRRPQFFWGTLVQAETYQESGFGNGSAYDISHECSSTRYGHA
jgi:hypothetical protein